MSTPEKKLVVLKRDNAVISPRELLDREFLIDLRRSLLQQLAVIEKKLNLSRRCRQCGFDLSTK